jgi:hypothetical protein
MTCCQRLGFRCCYLNNNIHFDEALHFLKSKSLSSRTASLKGPWSQALDHRCLSAVQLWLGFWLLLWRGCVLCVLHTQHMSSLKCFGYGGNVSRILWLRSRHQGQFWGSCKVWQDKTLKYQSCLRRRFSIKRQAWGKRAGIPGSAGVLVQCG